MLRYLSLNSCEERFVFVVLCDGVWWDNVPGSTTRLSKDQFHSEQPLAIFLGV